LEATINDNIHDLIETSANRDEEEILTWLILKMKTKGYEIFIKNGSYISHEGFRHIYLKDASRSDVLNFSDQINYRQLRYWQSRYSLPKI
jgi:hypothetical protein